MTPTLIPDDASARAAIRTDLDHSLCVEAAAGTGKTTELVNRIVAVLRTGRATIDRIVAVTFTNKAAGEMKLRLRQALDEERDKVAGDAAANIEAALQHLEDAAIGTIHSFCGQILRERPVEAGIDPAFVEAAEQETRALYSRAFRSWFEDALEQNPPGLRRELARLAWGDATGGSATEQLQQAGWKLIEWRDFPAVWSRPAFDRGAEVDEVASFVAKLGELSAKCRYPKDALFAALAPVRELAAWVERSESARSRDYDTLEALLVKLPRDLRRNMRTGRGSFADGVPREQLVECRDLLLKRLDAFRQRADADLAVLLQSEMQSLVRRYDRLKTRAGRLDFTDLLLRVRNLLKDNREVRNWLQGRFSHLFVDEFQDTDPLQAEILILLAAKDPACNDWRSAETEPGKLFLVGDPKQSIYKFRRADVLLYQEIRDRLVGQGVNLVYLTRSFRAVELIQSCINAAFTPEMAEDPVAGQARYVPLEKERPAIAGQPSVIALPVPRPYGSSRVSKIEIGKSLPDAIGAYVWWLLNESGWQVYDCDSKSMRAMWPSDIAILFRRFLQYGDDVTRPYVRALEARDVPHLLVGSKSFHQREEVETVRAACTAIEWPDDELSVYATLHGSLFAINDNLLLRFRTQVGRLHPLAPREGKTIDAELQPVVEALEILAGLHWNRNRRAIADTVNALLESVRAHAGFAFRPGGNQVLGNVYRIVDLARSYETCGGISFRGFVDELNARAERSDAAEAPVVEEGAEGVRLMTVHSAKGLEFPVVILADMNANLQSGDPDRYIDATRGLCALRLLWCAPQELTENEPLEREREQAEGIRVAYVAATRARDLLVVPVVGDDEREGWLSPLSKALYPTPDRRRWASVAAGCPAFGYRSVVERPIELDQQQEFSVKPGGHKPREGTHEVVWWDPAVLNLRVEEKYGLPWYRMLMGDAEPSVAAHDTWRQRRGTLLETGSKPSLSVFVPSETGEQPSGIDAEIRFESTVRHADRPSGRRFGTLVHAVLRDALGGAAAVRALAESQARLLGATPEETAAAVEAVEEALRHPFVARALAAEQAHRELPLLYRLEDGRMLEGVVDLAFRDGDDWTVVDFKTDAELGAKRRHYEAQLRWYALALSRLTGRPARCVLLSV